MRKKRVDLNKSKEKLEISNFKGLMKLDINDIKNLGRKKSKHPKRAEKKRKVVAFDVGHATIKIVQGIYFKNNLSLDKFVEVPTPKGAIKDGAIVNIDAILSVLQEALLKNSISAKEGICTNNSTTIINRELLVPKVESDELETVVRYEIQQYLPINLDDYVLQTNILGEEELDGNTKLNVRAIAYPEKMARGYYELLNGLNLKPFVLDVNYNALNKLANYIEVINEYEYNSKEVAVFIDMGATSLDVNIYDEGILQFTRIIKAGGANIDDILVESLNISKEEVENYKENNIDLRPEKLGIQENAIVIEIDEWIDKIEKVIQFYKNKNMGIDINNVFIYGGTARIKGLSEYMASKLLMNVVRIRSISKIDFNDYNGIEESVDSFINAIGSIIRIGGE